MWGSPVRQSAVVNDTSQVQVAPHRARPIAAGDVLTLYQGQSLWPYRTAWQVAEVLDTAPAVGAWRQQELVGFARAVTDGRLRAYVEDVVVSPDVRAPESAVPSWRA